MEDKIDQLAKRVTYLTASPTSRDVTRAQIWRHRQRSTSCLLTVDGFQSEGAVGGGAVRVLRLDGGGAESGVGHEAVVQHVGAGVEQRGRPLGLGLPEHVRHLLRQDNAA